ncbi:MAG TPA: DUF2301 domain-containing membrane protein [Stenomitos sp.]
MLIWLQETGEVYQGQFGEFTVTRQDRLGVVIYRTALTTAALAVALATALTVTAPASLPLTALRGLFIVFCSALGVSLWTIHIYLKPLHQLLQLLWALGSAVALGIVLLNPQPLPLVLYTPHSVALVGVGLVFVALVGLFVKEAFCFNRWQAKLLVVLVPSLLLGHWLGLLSIEMEKTLLCIWAAIFLWFVLDKDTQAIPPDVGDKTVFDYLKHQNHRSAD